MRLYVVYNSESAYGNNLRYRVFIFSYTSKLSEHDAPSIFASMTVDFSELEKLSSVFLFLQVLKQYTHSQSLSQG